MFLAKIIVPEGTEDVKVGSIVAIVVDNAGDVAEVKASTYTPAGSSAAASSSASAAPAPAPATGGASAPSSASAGGHGGSSDAAHLDSSAVMPSARALMAVRGVSSASVKGTGKNGRITKGDVLAHLGMIPASALGAAPAATAAAPKASAPASSASAPSAPTASAAPASASAATRPGGTYTDTKPSQVRKVIASRLTESKAKIPHQYYLAEMAIDQMLALRVTLKDAGINVSVNDMVIKAAARALRDVPEANCFYDPKSDSVKANSAVDISVAVATDGGLITPIVKSADALGLLAINEKVKELAGRARANKLKPEEFQGGSFTISNLGMFGIDFFSAVINPPQACILAIGKGEKKVVLPPITSLDDLQLGGASAAPPKATVATMMTVQLSADARVVDPAIAGQYLAAVRHYVENPKLLVA
jgi:pyruvate dehydrogenase E2 component (dihydrolipoamide acetyltransferase)